MGIKTAVQVIVSLCIVTAALLIAGCTDKPGTEEVRKPQTAKKASSEKKKVLFVNSYHRGYKWSDGISEGAMDSFGASMNADGEIDNSESKVIFKIIYMDTKLNKSEEFKKSAALRARKVIQDWQPDVVITSDDNAVKYLLVPYFKDSSTPFVFCGVNDDATPYGLPFENSTGMVEVSLISQIIEELLKYSKGNKMGLLGQDNISSHKIAAKYNKTYPPGINKRHVNTFEEWKLEFRELQNNVDMMLTMNYVGIKGWNEQEAIEFVEDNIRIPIACQSITPLSLCVFGYTMVAQEQGQWAAKTALQILDGKRPRDIAVTTNQKAEIYLNMRLAKKLGIVFPMELIEQATFVGENSVN